MSLGATADAGARPSWPGAARPSAGPWAGPDARRRLQLALGALWLLDAALQFQSVMFTRAFSQMLAASAAGNPFIVARPITWSAGLIGQHAVAANTVFAFIQLLLGLGIAWRRTVKAALAASVAWAVAVWWLGEGLGGLLNGTASPAGGAPGAAILYALLAVLLWPAARPRPAPFAAGLAVGPRASRALWLVLWGSLAYFALQPAARAPRGLSGLLRTMASGQPGWLAWLDRHAAAALAGQGLLTSVLLATALAVAAAGPCLPPRWARAALALAMAVAAFLWLTQGLGGLLSDSATDPDTGPLLALLALAYWPAVPAAPLSPAVPAGARVSAAVGGGG